MAVPAESEPQESKSGGVQAVSPPQVPPRTKKKSTKACSEVQTHSEREVLVANCRGSRERKAESRQRQPPAMLVRQGPEVHEEDAPAKPIAVHTDKPRRGPHLLVLPPHKGPRLYGPMHLHQPIRLIPVQPVSVTYGNWIRKVGPAGSEIQPNLFRRILANHVVVRPVKVQPAGRGPCFPFKFALNAGAPAGLGAKCVNRSGSLSSQGSIGSDSGNESRPKSALRKVRRGSLEPKKCVTFNAMTTVQVMEE